MSDELIARLRAAADDVSKATPALSALAHGIKLVDWSPDIREAADRIEELEKGNYDALLACNREWVQETAPVYARIERMEAVVEAARTLVPGAFAFLYQSPYANRYELLRSALAALGAQINNTTHADKVRCPNCSEKDASIAELIETLQRTEAAANAAEKVPHCAVCAPRIYDEATSTGAAKEKNA